MGEINAAPFGFAYLFEKFPSFSQTFCAREVEAMRGLGLEFPIYSIRQPAEEPPQDLFGNIGEVTYLPEKYDSILESDASFRRAARKGLETLSNVWGSGEQKRRIYEALWLGPRLQKAGISHVHVHFAGLAARTAFWLKKLFGIRYSITAHANDIFRDEPPERLRQIFEAASVVVTVSDFSLGFLKEHYPTLKDRFCRVYNGIQTRDFPVSSLPAGRPLIISVGRYIEKKGFDVLIDACAALDQFDFECHIIGHGPQEELLQEKVRKHNLGGKVFITEPKTEGEIKLLLGRAHLFVLACVRAHDGAMDNLPTVIMEAMAAGLPVISTALAAVPEMVLNGETGFVVPERNAAALSEQMAVLLNDRVMAKAFGRQGRERCCELFDLERTASSLRDILTTHGAFSRNPAEASTAA